MKSFSKNGFYFLIGFSFIFLAVFGYQSLFGEKDTVTEKKTSVNQSETTVKNDPKPITINRKIEPVAFDQVPLSVVCSYLYDTYQITILPGEFKNTLVSLVGTFPAPAYARKAFSAAIKKQGLYLNGSPQTVTAYDPEPVFTRVDWGRSGNQIYIFHGKKLYRVEEFPFMLRRDHFGNFHAALSPGSTAYPAPSGAL